MIRTLFDFSGARMNVLWRVITLLALVYVLVVTGLGLWWSLLPGLFDPREVAAQDAAEQGHRLVTGYTTTTTVIRLGETLLTKPGGYLHNDIAPPGLLLDDMPNWEFGVLVQIRDMVRVMRNDLSRSQSQSAEEPNLMDAEGKFYFDADSWIFPASEDEYRDGIRLLKNYRKALADTATRNAQFFARADNLSTWLRGVESRLGSLSQRLSASRGKRQLNTDLAGDPAAQQSTPVPNEADVRTPWLQIDDVFYEARGQTWALLHLMRAAEVDFRDVLEKKNALISVRQIIRELESTQDPIWMPYTLNGHGFGIFANYSYSMASYVSRSHAAIIDLRELLKDG